MIVGRKNGFKVFILETERRPAGFSLASECERCNRKLRVRMEWWRMSGDDLRQWLDDAPEVVERNAAYWVTSRAMTDIMDRLCRRCQDNRLNGLAKAREYETTVPPPDWRPWDAGESWF